MNPGQLNGLVRNILAAILGFLAGKGWFPSDWIGDAVGLGGVIVVAIWSYYSNSISAMIDALSKDKDVHEIIVTPEVARTAGSDKVTVSTVNPSVTKTYQTGLK